MVSVGTYRVSMMCSDGSHRNTALLEEKRRMVVELL